MSNSSGVHGLQPPRFLCPWDSPGKNAGVKAPSPGDLLSAGIEPGSPELETDTLLSEPQSLMQS